jgi:hypothetical protein
VDAVVLDDVGGEFDLVDGLLVGLAHLGRDRLGQLVLALVEDLRGPAHDSCALLDICVLPGQVRAVSGGDGAFDLSIGRLGEGFDDLAGGGVLDTVVRHGMQLLADRRELGGSGARRLARGSRMCSRKGNV